MIFEKMVTNGNIFAAKDRGKLSGLADTEFIAGNLPHITRPQCGYSGMITGLSPFSAAMTFVPTEEKK